MNPTHDRAVSMLGAAAAAGAKCDAADQSISAGAQKRLDAVLKRMEELRPQVLVSADAADEYQGLTLERRRLQQVVMPS